MIRCDICIHNLIPWQYTNKNDALTFEQCTASLSVAKSYIYSNLLYDGADDAL